MSIKIVFAVIATLVNIASFFPYIQDIFQKKTRPHAFTWLIWTLTQGTAVTGLWIGGGGVGALGLTVSTVLVFFVFLLALRYGSKNTTPMDLVVLCVALIAIICWWQLHNPWLAILTVTAIDVLGYVPTFRKVFREPQTEAILPWIGWVLGNGFSLLALQQYNLLTMTYLISITTANILIVSVCVIRRRKLIKTREKRA